MQIIVKTLTGKVIYLDANSIEKGMAQNGKPINLNVEPFDSIETVKSKI